FRDGPGESVASLLPGADHAWWRSCSGDGVARTTYSSHHCCACHVLLPRCAYSIRSTWRSGRRHRSRDTAPGVCDQMKTIHPRRGTGERRKKMIEKEARLLRIGVVGAGPIAQAAHFDACRKARNAELYAIGDLAADLVTQMAAIHHPHVTYLDYDEM